MKKKFRSLTAALLALLLVAAAPVTAAGNQAGGSGSAESAASDSSASTASTYTSVTAPGSFTSSDSSDNTLSVIAYYNSSQSETVSDLSIEDTTSGVNGVVVNNADVDFNNISIILNTDADGSDTCDFTGKGTAFAVYGNSNVTLSNSTISTTGVATMPLFTDDGATLTVQSSTIESLGGTLYSNYVNTADQSAMVAPPWVLGIMGTSRASNLMGTDSTLNFLDSTAKAALWAVLSTDSGSNMVMNVYNSTLELTQATETDKTIQASGGQITTYDNPYTSNYGSGYGTYVIGDAEENMVGVTMNVGTYASIFTGGTMSFSTLTAGDYTLSNADGSTTSYTYSGNTRNSVINSDTFGFMAHQNDNTLTLGSGTALNTGYTGFLIKTGGSLTGFTADVTDADISVGNNVLIQLLDNEDSLIGTSSGTTFVTTYTESSGWNTSGSSDSGSSGGSSGGDFGGGNQGGGSSGGGPGGRSSGIATTADSSSSDYVIFNFSDMDDLTGNIYNASGYQLTGTGVTVNLSNTTYSGAAASTTAIHVTYEGSNYVRDTLNGYALDADTDSTLLGYQNTEITISEYYDLGHVANMINSNGSNTVTMTLSDNSVWYVTGTSVVDSLSVDSDSSIVLVGDATLTVGSTVYSADNLASYMTHVDSLDSDEEEECEHEYTSEVTTAATCTEDGVMTYTCSKCGDTYTETIAATGHSYEAVVTAPSCTERGYTTYTCSVCGDSYTGDETEATGHSYDEGVVITAATCTEDGVMTFTCSVCGAAYTETIPATGHTEGEAVTENEVAATCTEDGSYDSVVYCSVCGEELSRETVTVAATGHTYVDGVCTVCGEEETEEEVTEPTIVSVVASGSRSVTITGSWPSTYTVDGVTYVVTSYGFVYIRTSRLGSNELTALTTGRVKVIFSTSTSYTIVGTKANTTYTVRAYITYTNAEGKTVYVYSDPIVVSHDTASSE